MPTRLAAAVLQVDTTKIKQVDTGNVEDLFGIWTVFNKCAESMEDGRRLENLSWRLWNRETFCCQRAHSVSDKSFSRRDSDSLPELSSSVDSLVDDDADSVRSIKHITSYKFQELVAKIKTKEELPKPPPRPSQPIPTQRAHAQPSTIRVSAETVSTADFPSMASSQAESSQGKGSETSINSELSSHSIIRGFTAGEKGVCSYRSQSRLAPLPAPQPPAMLPKPEEHRKKALNFQIGADSSADDDSSFDDSKQQLPHRSSLSDGLRKPHKKQTSFLDPISTRVIQERAHEDEAVIDDSEDDEDAISESAIDDDDSDDDWEDSATDSGQSSVNDKQMFPRVDSRPNLRSRRSLLTQMVHQTDRQNAFAMKACRSTSALQRSRTSSPNGPSLAASPEDDANLVMAGPGIARPRPIMMTKSNSHQPSLSPRTTRRNMLASELSESLRKHLIRERQQKAAPLRRRHTAQDVANLQEYPNGRPSHDTSTNNSWNHYIDDGAGGYHQRGW
ncbi:MAG: hypothetical protein M1814_003251 [Vezdaea aestivalis]|nr:MAG: hypothetical protein M1814_003251 [Vezdaea aestivalis]